MTDADRSFIGCLFALGIVALCVGLCWLVGFGVAAIAFGSVCVVGAVVGVCAE